MANWKGKSKGSPLGYRFFILIIKVFGLGFTYRILRFVTFYYYIFAKSTKKNLRIFYAKVPGIKANQISSIIRKNFNFLGESIVDRFAFLIGKGNKITYTQEGEIYLKEFVEKQQPLILISAHIGNWEIAGNLLQKLNAKVNVVLFDGEDQRLKKTIQKKVGSTHFNSIPIKEDLSHVYAIHAAVKRGEIICIHGDRFLNGAKTIETSLFNNLIDLPYGSFQIAARLNVHHCFIFAIKDAKFNYHFTATKPELLKSPKEIADKYTTVLAQKIIQNPEQWFNYHPFYKEDADNKR